MITCKDADLTFALADDLIQWMKDLNFDSKTALEIAKKECYNSDDTAYESEISRINENIRKQDAIKKVVDNIQRKLECQMKQK